MRYVGQRPVEIVGNPIPIVPIEQHGLAPLLSVLKVLVVTPYDTAPVSKRQVRMDLLCGGIMRYEITVILVDLCLTNSSYAQTTAYTANQPTLTFAGAE